MSLPHWPTFIWVLVIVVVLLVLYHLVLGKK
jgi:hypothetical protein